MLSTFLVSVSLITAGPSAALAKTVTIAALGDSLTQGYGLLQEEGFTAQLQDWLDAAQSDVTLINAGVSGDTTAGGLSRADWTLTPDVDAMIVALGGNDVLRGTAPEIARANLAGILDIAALKNVPVLLIGIDVPENYGTDYKSQFTAIYTDLAAEYDTLLIDSFLRPLTEIGPMSEVLNTYFQGDGIHPNAKGVSIIVQSVGPSVSDLADQVRARSAQ
nr:arylesterase [Pacificibacter marinus]